MVVTGQDTAHRQLTYALLDIERRHARPKVSIVQARASLQRIIETRAAGHRAVRRTRSQQVVQLNQMAATFAGKSDEQEILGRVPSQWLPRPRRREAVGRACTARSARTPGSVQRELHRAADIG